MAVPARVLFLSANMGTGHAAAAEATLRALRERLPDVDAQIINSVQYASQRVGKMVEEGYIHLLKAFPTLYGLIYESKERPSSLSGVRRVLNRLYGGTFRNLIESWKPDVIVCTHAFPFGIISSIRERFGLRVPSVGIVTDFVVHPGWVHKNVDVYAVANDDLERQLIARGVESERVRVTGIPIDPRFGQPRELQALRDRLDLNAGLPVVLVMGGGLGMGPVERIMKLVRRIERPMHMVVLAGRNERLREQLDEERQRLGGHPVRLQSFGYIDNVYDYMAAADLLVTKPGGLTSAEALASGLPMVIIHPLPGQEMRNSKYLLNKRVAVRAASEKTLPTTIEEMLRDVDTLRRMRRVSRDLSAPDSASRTADLVLEMLAKPRAACLAP